MMSILADHWIDQMFPTPILTVRALSLGWISSALKVTKIQAAYHQTSVIQMSKFGVSTPKSTGFLQVQSCKTYFEKLMLMELCPTFFFFFFFFYYIFFFSFIIFYIFSLFFFIILYTFS